MKNSWPEKQQKQIGDIRVTLRNDNDRNRLRSDSISKLKRVCTIYTRKVEHKWYSLFLRKVYTKCVSDEFLNLHHLLLESLCIDVKAKSKLQVEKLYRKIASQLRYLRLVEKFTPSDIVVSTMQELPMTKNQTRSVDHPSSVLIVLLGVGMIFACWPSALLFCLDFLDSESPMEHMFSTRSRSSLVM